MQKVLCTESDFALYIEKISKAKELKLSRRDNYLAFKGKE